MMQSFEDSIDIVSAMIDDDSDISDVIALESAADSMAFTQSLWNLFKDHGLITSSDDPDFYTMEKVIDSLYGELAAVTLMFSDSSFDLSNHVDKVIQMFERTNSSLKKANTDGSVPPEIVQGFKAFANRLENAKKVKAKYIKDSNDKS